MTISRFVSDLRTQENYTSLVISYEDNCISAKQFPIDCQCFQPNPSTHYEDIHAFTQNYLKKLTKKEKEKVSKVTKCAY
jgi:hypothetical protein